MRTVGTLLKGIQEMYRVKLHINQGPMSGYKIIATSKFDSWEQAEDILDRATRTGFAMGGHIEILVEIAGIGNEWYLCNEKPELV